MELAATVTDEGTLNPALLLFKFTTVADEAAVLSVTVQVLDPTPTIEVAVHAIELSVTVGAGVGLRTKLAVFDPPFSVAVTVTVALVEPLLLIEN